MFYGVRNQAEVSLQKEGMSEQEINIKDIDELKKDIVRINYMINNPHEFISNIYGRSATEGLLGCSDEESIFLERKK